ncbi:MAG: MBL fold metallo-hydrolase [Clostridiaceae bacterium]|mgnify:CR=1 FL=1|jgi:metallo-beta-lactamase family protein|nr:MBL fold metallo-hydrolase [Clostridiaceae bacterium]
MKLTFLGATRTVTGSCSLLEVGRTKILIDCGMFQGRAQEEAMNEQPLPVPPSEVDYVLLTHAHIDHSGRVPWLYVNGFEGEVLATKAATDLCGLLLPDSGHIQEFEIEWKNRKRKRAGRKLLEPLYTHLQAQECMKLFRTVAYDDKIQLTDNITVRYRNSGHMLGSAFIEVWVREDQKETKLVFTGDIGNRDIPILKDPEYIQETDYLIMESTYGDRIHQDRKNKAEKFLNIVLETLDRGGNVIIPSFAVGRTQEIIYEINKTLTFPPEKVKKLMDAPVYLDSPLAISATEVYRNNLECYDEEARCYVENGDNPLDFPNLHFTRTADESKTLNKIAGGCIVISASGMCEAGRIKHHLKHNLWREKSTILFVGYQAEGTLGQRILDGAKKVKIFGEEISVNAQIESIDGYSGHADYVGLLDWIGKFEHKPKRIFLVHGNEKAMTSLSEKIKDEYSIETIIPSREESFVIEAQREISREIHADRRFRYLPVINLLEDVKEGISDMAELLMDEMIEGVDDKRLTDISKKLKLLQKEMVGLLEAGK